MKLGRVLVEGETRAATFVDGAVHVLGDTVGILDVLSAEPDERERMVASGTRELALSTTQLLAPLEPPTIRDFSVFEQHIEGASKGRGPDAQVPEVWYEGPFCYFSNPHAVNGPGADIPVPPGCERLDFELEIAAVIGHAGRNLAPEDASAYIAGYTIFNDWSARDLQRAEMRLGLGICKGKDFASTLGPWIVTADELEPYRDGDRLDIELRAELNGTVFGRDTLANMAWSFAELVSYASRGTWVRPGDILGSGTCGGGCLMELWGRNGPDAHPPLGPGDVVSLHAEGIGELTNTVVAGEPLIGLPAARRGRRLPRDERALASSADGQRRSAGPDAEAAAQS